MAAPEREQLASRMREQAGWCARLGSSLYAHLLEQIALDAGRGGPSAEILAGHSEDPLASALALRLMGAVHRLVLQGEAPALAAHYPSAGGTDRSDAWPAFETLLRERTGDVRALLARPVQTNEVGRSAALLGGFLQIARETGLPLALVELGASAGLNLRWDHFRFDAAGWSWGETDSPVRIACEFTGSLPPRDVAVRVVARDGCDAQPIDATSHEGTLTLQSYLWADQLDRLALLRAAIELARRIPGHVVSGDAAAWIAPRLVARERGVATVVYHSIFWQYMSRDRRAAVKAAIDEAGAGAAAHRPLAWLRLEPVGREGPYEIRLTSWPGGRERRLGEGSPHGRQVHWSDA
jgi:hypothetical protein